MLGKPEPVTVNVVDVPTVALNGDSDDTVVDTVSVNCPNKAEVVQLVVLAHTPTVYVPVAPRTEDETVRFDRL